MIVARLVENSSGRYILHNDGTLLKAEIINIKEFLMFFKSHSYFSENDTRWDSEYTDISFFPGETIAEIVIDPYIEYSSLGENYDQLKYKKIQEKNTFLKVHSPTIFNEIIKAKVPVDYITTAEYAALHNRSEESIKKHCQAGRIVGIENINGRWMIPAKAPYPLDLRTARPKKKKSKFR